MAEIGHVTVCLSDVDEVRQLIKALLGRLEAADALIREFGDENLNAAWSEWEGSNANANAALALALGGYWVLGARSNEI